MSNYWETLRQRKISRRTMLGASAKAGVGAAGLALVGCGDDDTADAGTAAAERAASAAEEAAAAAVAAGEARAAETEAAADAAAEAAAAASEASAAASQAADAADAAAALAAEAAESEDAANAAAAAEAAAAAAAQAAEAASAAGDEAAAAVAAAASEAAEAAAQAARDAAAAVEAGTATAEAAQAAIDEAAEAAAAAAAAAGEASAAAGEAAATAQETAEAAAETAAAAVAAAEEAADAAREAAESAAMAGEDEPAAAGGPVYGGKIVRVAEGDIDSGWNPHRTTTNLDNFNFLQYIYDYVLGYSGDNGAAKAELAESWEIPDDVTYLFNFAPGRAVFQDGAPVDANAMQANMEFLRDDEEATPSTKAGIANAASFEAVDDVTWRMVNSEVVGPTLSKFYDQTGSGNLISPNALETAHEHPVGAGPARPVEYRVGEYWLGEKWDGYWDNEHVYADQLEVRIIPDANNAWAQFLDGEISYQPAAGVMTDELAAELEADGFQVSRGLSLGWNAQWFNLNPAAEGFNMFRDPRLRWAIGLSVDRDVVNDLSEDGLGKPSVCNTTPLSWAIREGANYYDPPDLAKAAQLRDAAGFGDDNPVTGDFLTINNLSPRTGPAVFAQLQQAGWSGLNLLEGSLSFIFEVFATGTDHVTSVMPWASPFDPDVVMGPSIDQGLRNWMHGSPEGGPGTGRASLAENPNDQVLQDIAETEAYTVAATKFARQEDRIEPYDKAFASACDGNSWSDPDIQGHRWWYYWLQLSAGYGAQGNLGGGFHIRPIDGFTSSSSGGHGYKGLWNNV